MIRRMAVIVPAADEEEHIGDCLAAIDAAQAYLYRGTGIRAQTVVVLDRCQDQTPVIASRFTGVDLVTLDERNVGLARRAGAHQVLTGGGRASELWLASTDADSQVPANWLRRMLAEAQAGTQLVLGTVLPGPGLRAALHRDWLSLHHLREGHPHVHGANLGIRGDTYLALGGWPSLQAGEDVELVRRAMAAGHLRISRTAAIPVLTSPRPFNRVPHGFSGYLRDLAPAAALAQ